MHNLADQVCNPFIEDELTDLDLVKCLSVNEGFLCKNIEEVSYPG